MAYNRLCHTCCFAGGVYDTAAAIPQRGKRDWHPTHKLGRLRCDVARNNFGGLRLDSTLILTARVIHRGFGCLTCFLYNRYIKHPGSQALQSTACCSFKNMSTSTTRNGSWCEHSAHQLQLTVALPFLVFVLATWHQSDGLCCVCLLWSCLRCPSPVSIWCAGDSRGCCEPGCSALGAKPPSITKAIRRATRFRRHV